MNLDAVYAAYDPLPGFYAGRCGDVWCQRLHLDKDQMSEREGEDGLVAYVNLKEKGGDRHIVCPTFAFDEEGCVLPLMLENDFAIPVFEDHWVVREMRRAIEASHDSPEPAKYCYVVTTDVWPQRVSVVCTWFELEPAPLKVRCPPPVLYDHQL